MNWCSFGWAALPVPADRRQGPASSPRCVITLILPAAQMSNFGGWSGYDMAKSARSLGTMTLLRAMALLSALTLAGLSEAAAQFPPSPGQNAPATQSSPFPPPPGQQQQSSPFPPPGQQQQANPFPTPGQSSPIPATGGSFSPGGPRPGPPPPGAQPPPVCLQFRSDPRAGGKGWRRHQNRQRSQGAARGDLRAVQQSSSVRKAEW